MAILANSSLLLGMRGVLGGLVFKTVGNRTVVSALPCTPRSRKGSPLQDLNRSRFKEASDYAKVVTRHNHEKKEYYQRKAREMNLPNAYTAAITDFMRKGRIRSINARGHAGKQGGEIIIETTRKNFSVSEVNVTITTKAGLEIETGKAVPTSSGNRWIYKSNVNISDRKDLVIVAGAMDHLGKTTHAIATKDGYGPRCTYGWGGDLALPEGFINSGNKIAEVYRSRLSFSCRPEIKTYKVIAS